MSKLDNIKYMFDALKADSHDTTSEYEVKTFSNLSNQKDMLGAFLGLLHNYHHIFENPFKFLHLQHNSFFSCCHPFFDPS